MAAHPARPLRRRPRHGSLERPVNARMYRGTWLLVGLPLLIAAFTVARPAPLPAPTLPPTFDPDSARALAEDLADRHPDRSPGSLGATGAARWLSQHLAAYGFETQAQEFVETIPGRGKTRLVNLLAVAPGRSPRTIVVMAHRDNLGTGRGANDNASGTAALVELARAFTLTQVDTRAVGESVKPAHTILFLSTDGGAFGSLGAAHFVADRAYRGRIVAVINLDSIGAPAPARIQFAGDEPRSPAAAFVQTATSRLLEQTGREPARPSAFRQLIDLGFPFSLYEQAPFVARGIPAITLTTSGDRPPPSFGDTARDLNRLRLGELGRSAQTLLGSLDQGLELGPSRGSYVYLGPRLIRGWAIQLVLVASLLPFLAAAVDLFARCRRRRIALAPALRSYRSRLAFWLFVGALFWLFAVLGAWPDGTSRPLAPETEVAGTWPLVALAALAVPSALAWLVTRDRLIPRRQIDTAEELAGYTSALLVLGVLGLVVVATNPYALLFVLPSLHAWVWLPQVRDRPPWVRLAVLGAGLAGPLLLVSSFAVRFGLGFDAPWYLAALVAIGYVDTTTVLLFLAWLAAAGQLTALTVRRYAPYPSAAERRPRGPFRETVRRTVLAVRARRRNGRREEPAVAEL